MLCRCCVGTLDMLCGCCEVLGGCCGGGGRGSAHESEEGHRWKRKSIGSPAELEACRDGDRGGLGTRCRQGRRHRRWLGTRTGMGLNERLVPVEGAAAGTYAWHDGPFLAAMRAGDWVILDELNLAPQPVLEGLNACLDHRATVFIPELGASFACAPSFRVFGCQNPLQQGGGRKGLPKSFLNRFTRVHVEPMEKTDMAHITAALFPAIPASAAERRTDPEDALEVAQMLAGFAARAEEVRKSREDVAFIAGKDAGAGGSGSGKKKKKKESPKPAPAERDGGEAESKKQKASPPEPARQ